MCTWKDLGVPPPNGCKTRFAAHLTVCCTMSMMGIARKFWAFEGVALNLVLFSYFNSKNSFWGLNP